MKKLFQKEMSGNKLFSLSITSIIIGLLFIAGPVDALHLALDGFKNTPYVFGEKINFMGKIDIESNEIVDIQSVSVEVNDNIVCTFDAYGSILSGCYGMNISLVSNNAAYGYGYGYNNFNLGWNGSNSSSNAGHYTGYGYGYGYGYASGELVYNVSIQTPQGYLNIPGNNDIKLIANSNSQTFNSRTERIVMRPIANTGQFLFGTDDLQALFWGTYDGNTNSLNGTVYWYGNSITRVGTGTYNPINGNSGDLYINFKDPNNPMDPGMNWVGHYGNGRWVINYTLNPVISFNGKVIQAPR